MIGYYITDMPTSHTEGEVVVEERRRGGRGEHSIWEKVWNLWHLINISCSVSNFLRELKTCAPIRCISVIGNSHLTMETDHWKVKQDYSNNRN